MIDYDGFRERNNGRTQTEMVSKFMDEYGSITTYDAFCIGIARLSARIWDLTHDKDGNKTGYIKTVTERNGRSNYTRYSYE